MWLVDVEAGSARIVGEKRRQLRAMAKRLDVRPIAASLADAIANGRADDHLMRVKDGRQVRSIICTIGEIGRQPTHTC
jgi:hypothetical protein